MKFTGLSTDQMHHDLTILEDVLRSAHPGLFDYIDDRTFSTLLDAAAHAAYDDHDELVFLRTVSRLTASIGCGHTNVELPPETKSALIEHGLFIPFEPRFIGRRAIIYHDFTPDNGLPVGAEILAINGQAMPDIIDSLYAHMRMDAGIESGKRATYERMFFWYFYLYGDASDVFELVLDINGHEVAVLIPALTLMDLKMIRNGRYPDIVKDHQLPTVLWRIESDYAYLRIKHFYDRDIPMMLVAAFQDFTDQGVENLILDLRGNFGGYDELGTLLERYLIPEPFEPYINHSYIATDMAQLPHVELDAEDFEEYAAIQSKKSTPLQNSGRLGELIEHYIESNTAIGRHQPVENYFSGNLVTLIDGGSFSSGAEVAALLHAHEHGRFVGDETGGAYHGCNGGILPELVLPNSQLRIMIPLIKYNYNVNQSEWHGHGIMPDYPVSLNLDDLYADSALIAAITLF